MRPAINQRELLRVAPDGVEVLRIVPHTFLDVVHRSGEVLALYRHQFGTIPIQITQPAPDLELRTDDGRSLHLSELRGKPVVLYFYPKDDTPGCTAEACAIRDAWSDFRSHGAEVFGVSTQDAESHSEFRDKYQLPFPLLIDEGQELANAFGVEAYDRDGETYYRRSTVVIDEDGKVAKVMEKVDPTTHADEVLAAL